MGRKTSMTRKLVVAVTSVVAVSWLIAAGLSVLVIRDELSEVFDSGVQGTAERLLPLVARELSVIPTDAPRRLAQSIGDGEEYLVFQVRDQDGRVLLHSHDTSSQPFDSPLETGFSYTPTQRIYTVATTDGSLYVQVADSLDHRREATREAGSALLLPLLVLVPASVLAIVLVVRATLSPIEGLRDDIGHKDGGNMVPIDETPLPKELRPIARSVNLLLERLRSALDAEREFTSNSAHELRTPIAGALAQTQRLKAEIPPALAVRVNQIEKSLLHLGRLAEKLLQMSRAEAGIGVSDVSTDLIPVLQVVIQDIERSSIGHQRVRTHLIEGRALERTISPDAFGILARNLLENALIHSPAGSPVDVYVEGDGQIRIVNAGAAIDGATLQGLVARFARGPTEAAGSGLGLSIAKRLVEQMNGTLILSSPASGRNDGFEARVRL